MMNGDFKDYEIKEDQFDQFDDNQIKSNELNINKIKNNESNNNELKDYQIKENKSKDNKIKEKELIKDDEIMDCQIIDNQIKDNRLKNDSSNNQLKVDLSNIQSKDNEIKELKGKLDKVIKENDNLKKFNNDLRDQVKLLTGKLNLFQKLNTSSSQSNSSNKSTTKDDHQDLIKESISKNVKIKDLVTSIAQDNVSSNDYIYDSKIKAYLSKSTGWYFYQESNLFFDPKTNNYYSYNREKNTFTFHSNLDDINKKAKEDDNNLKELKIKIDKLTKENENLKKLINNDCEDGEILSDSDSVEIIEDKECDYKRKKQKLNQEYYSIDKEDDSILPCVRLIVRKSTNDLDLGSLLIITVNGGSIGKSIDCDQVLDDETIDELHAKITFNKKKNLYYIEDLNSSNGTFINDDKIEKNKLIKIKHDQVIRLGDNLEFLVHIHDGYHTCEFCEPGCVQAKLRSSIDQEANNCIYDYTKFSKEDKEKLRKLELKKIMKKFGINPYSESNNSNDNYKDRSEERRKEKGSSSEHFKIEKPNFDKPIEEDNKGRKLLEKWGFKKEDLKDTKIIETKSKDDRRGLGFM